MPRELALKVDNINVYYGEFHALRDVSLQVEPRQIVSVIGTNGSGKSTLLNAIAGLLPPSEGSVELFGEAITGMEPHQTVVRGVSLVPEGRRVFGRLTVFENLIMGAYTPRARKRRSTVLKMVYDLFPRLQERCNQAANTMSGGEQQMLAIGRALMSEPKLLLCDEISLGLAPLIIKDIYKKLAEINRQGVAIVLVEQDIKRSLKACQYAHVMLEGKVALSGDPASLTSEEIKKAYFGV